MMQTFDRILITHKPNPDAETIAIIDHVTSYASFRKIPIITEPDFSCDLGILIVSVGGDGTMLNAMRISSRYSNASIVGFNTGTLGFLTEEIPAKIYQYLDNILHSTQMFRESRMLLEGFIIVDGEEMGVPFIAANEFVFSTGANIPLVSDVYINEQFVSSQLGSGILVSSATGSTAMSLSAGGAIVSPSTHIMQIVPILPHTLTSRPIITNGDDEIIICTIINERVTHVSIQADGQSLFNSPLDIGTDVGIKIKQGPDARIWRPKNWNFFNVLTEKMKW